LRCRLMVGGAERHLRFDDEIIFEARVRFMERRPHPATFVDDDRLIRGFPDLVPVFVRHLFYRKQLHVGKGVHSQQFLHCVVIALILRAISLQGHVVIHERVKTQVSQHRSQHVMLYI